MMEKMIDDDKDDGSEKPEPEPSDNGISEDYISEVQRAMNNVIPEDFSSLSAEIPTDAEDGQEVVMVITGTAKGGKVSEALGAVVNLEGDEKPEKDEPGTGLKIIFSGEQKGGKQ